MIIDNVMHMIYHAQHVFSYMAYTLHDRVGTSGSYFICTYVCGYSTALAILKKHYHALWRSLPDDHLVTLTVLCDECENINPEITQMVATLQSSEQANEIMLDYVIVILKGDQQMMAFCDLMEKMINNPALSKVVSSLRTGIQFLI